MRKFAIGLLALFRRISLFIRKLCGKTEDDVAEQRVVSGESWDEFCDTLKAAGAALQFPGAPRDPFNQAEGYRYLSRIARAGLMAFIEHADAKAPVLHRVVNETTKLGADNPDNFYQTAALNGNYEYKISGRRNTVAYLSFGTQSGNYGQGRALVAGAPLLFAKWARNFQKHSNELPLFDPQVSLAAGGDPNITYYHSHWAIAEGEALLIEVTPPECEYWNFQLNNYWMESLDYRHHRIHTNKHLAHYEDDNSVRLIVAHENPGQPNWIETAGHTSGTMCFRWVRANENPQPRTRLAKISSLQD